MRVYPSSTKNAESLHSLYIKQKLSCREIGDILGVPGRLIHSWLCNFGIPTRNHKEAGSISATRYLNKQVTRVCPVCGKEFKVHLYRVKKSKKVYCSRKCQMQDSGKSLKKASEVYLKAHPKHIKICPVCGRTFKVNFARPQAKYCSLNCLGYTNIRAMASHKKPTWPEQQIIDIVNEYFPEFKYNGDGNLGVMLGGKIPDFVNVNGKKQVIEVFGDYYHGELCKTWKDSELGKKMTYNYLGYQCLVLWEHEIKTKTREELVNIIESFSKCRGKG